MFVTVNRFDAIKSAVDDLRAYTGAHITKESVDGAFRSFRG